MSDKRPQSFGPNFPLGSPYGAGSDIPPRPQPGPQPLVTSPQPPNEPPQDPGQSMWRYLLQKKPLSSNPPASLGSLDAEGSTPKSADAFPAPPNATPGLADAQPLAMRGAAPQPALPVENLTTRTLRMKGVPEADIAAAINNPAKMQDILNQYYGRRPIAPGDDSWAAYNRASQDSPADQPAQAWTPVAATPKNYLPFGWSGLQALLR